MAKNAENLINLKKLDPVVAQMITKGSELRKERQLPKRERRSLARERLKAEKRLDRRVGYDVDPEVTREIKAIADKNGTTASQVVQFALKGFLDAYHHGDIDLAEYRVVCDKNPRYEYMLEWRRE